MADSVEVEYQVGEVTGVLWLSVKARGREERRSLWRWAICHHVELGKFVRSDLIARSTTTVSFALSHDRQAVSSSLYFHTLLKLWLSFPRSCLTTCCCDLFFTCLIHGLSPSCKTSRAPLVLGTWPWCVWAWGRGRGVWTWGHVDVGARPGCVRSRNSLTKWAWLVASGAGTWSWLICWLRGNTIVKTASSERASESGAMDIRVKVVLSRIFQVFHLTLAGGMMVLGFVVFIFAAPSFDLLVPGHASGSTLPSGVFQVHNNDIYVATHSLATHRTSQP